MRYRVTFCVDVDAENEGEAYSLAASTVEGFGLRDAELSYTVEELQDGVARMPPKREHEVYFFHSTLKKQSERENGDGK